MVSMLIRNVFNLSVFVCDMLLSDSHYTHFNSDMAYFTDVWEYECFLQLCRMKREKKQIKYLIVRRLFSTIVDPRTFSSKLSRNFCSAIQLGRNGKSFYEKICKPICA